MQKTMPRLKISYRLGENVCQSLRGVPRIYKELLKLMEKKKKNTKNKNKPNNPLRKWAKDMNISPKMIQK
jgi:ribosomal protein S19